MEKTKINREKLWRKHETIQSQFKEWEEWYLKNTEVIERLDGERQEIVKKYFQFKNGEIQRTAQGGYAPLKDADLSAYDKEMAKLMSGEEEIED